ncbi:MAG: N-acetyltransferase [Bacteroidales bacterium]|nr:N-acetyltransferase [Bacteroidales bacterium]
MEQIECKEITMEYITEKNRIYVVENGVEAGEVTFPERDGAYVINHTYVDDRYRGQGIASELVRRAVEEIEHRGGRVEATCSYAQLWLARNRGCELTSPLSCPI